VYDSLSKPANDLRSKNLISVASTDIKKINIEAEGRKLALEKKGAAWELAEPKLAVDETAATDILGAITGLRAADFVAKDSPELTVAPAGFDKPTMLVSFTTAAPTTQPTTAPASQPAWTTITFGRYEDARKDKLFAMVSGSPAIVKVSSQPFKTLNKKPLDLRDRKLLDVNPAEVSKLSIITDTPAGAAPATDKPAKHTEVHIERRKQVADAATRPAATKPATTQVAATTQATTTQAVAAKPASTWELKTDPKGDADDTAISNLLTELHPLRVTKYLESPPTAKPTASYVIKLTSEGPGGTPVNNYELKLIDPGNDQPVQGEYNGLSFELARTFLPKLEGNFAKKAEEKPKGANDAADFKLPGEK
jgi:hypothetical protein